MTTTPTDFTPADVTAFGAQATKHAAEPTGLRPITHPHGTPTDRTPPNGAAPTSPAGGERPVQQVFNVRYLSKRRRASRNGDPAEGAPSAGKPRDRAGGWLLGVASVLLLLLAVAQGYVSFRAQYAFVHAEKGEHTASMLEALGLDAAAVIFALLALAQARLGRPAVAERALNLSCVVGSLAMNAMSADPGSVKSVAAWVLPAALYAAASDRLIAVVRRRALAGRPGADADGSPLAAARGVTLWALRLGMAPATTVKGFRAWVLDEAPVAPGRRALPTRRDLPALPAPDTATPPATMPDTTPDTRPDTGPDTANGDVSATVADTDPANRPATARRPLAATRRAGASARKAATRSRGKADRTADKARALLAANPDMSGAELGRRLKVSERTGLRYRAQILADTPSEPTDTDATTHTKPTEPTTGDDAR